MYHGIEWTKYNFILLNVILIGCYLYMELQIILLYNHGTCPKHLFPPNMFVLYIFYLIFSLHTFEHMVLTTKQRENDMVPIQRKQAIRSTR